MINSVTVTNHLGESKLFELRYPERSGFLVQSIEGLGPAKANINTTELSNTDGSIYNSARLNTRNIVLTLKLLSVPETESIKDVESVRLLTYQYFPIKKRIQLQFDLDYRICNIYGYVEANEPNIFSNQETTQISIICPDPYFYSTSATRTVLAGIDDLFEFPFSNESLSENLINMGEVITSITQNIVYDGDSEIGINVFIHALGEVTGLSIYNLTSGESIVIDDTRLNTLTGFGIIAGDDIYISTVKGNKYVRLLRGGVFINIINCLDISSAWLDLSKGINTFAFDALTGRSYLEVSIENNTIYEGV